MTDGITDHGRTSATVGRRMEGAVVVARAEDLALLRQVIADLPPLDIDQNVLTRQDPPTTGGFLR